MVLIIKNSKLFTASEKEKDVLFKMQNKDIIYIIASKDAVIPVSMFSLLNNIKAKIEFITIEEEDLFTRGFIYGQLVSQAKTSEEIIIMEDQLVNIDLPANIKWVTELEPSKPKRKRTVNKTPRETKEPVTEEKKESSKKEPANEGKSCSELVNAVCSYPKLKPYIKMLKYNAAILEECIKNASDSEIGLKIMLETRFGKQEGVTIWEVIHGDFDKLRKMDSDVQ